MHNPRKSPFAEHAKDALLGERRDQVSYSALPPASIITLLVGSCAYVLTGASQETQAAAVIFQTLSADARSHALSDQAAYWAREQVIMKAWDCQFTVIKGVLVGGSIAVIATLFTLHYSVHH